MFRKSQWEQVGGFCEDFTAGIEDYDFWLSLLELNCKVIQFDETFFHYRIKKNSRSSRFMENRKALLETYDLIYSRHRNFILSHVDTYCKELRKDLIDKMITNQILSSELRKPVVQYWSGITKIKPQKAARFEKWIKMKGKAKQLVMKGIMTMKKGYRVLRGIKEETDVI